MKRLLGTALLLLVVLASFAKTPKYVFYFIGDGMGPSHVLGTEYYLGELEGVIGRPNKLCFTQFPKSAFVSTFSKSNGVTDSAASGTALATGSKTKNGYLGVEMDTTVVYSVAHAAKQAGYAVGISSTVGINHATPGAFYAHQPGRSRYYEIGQDMLAADYDFYAGGDLIVNKSEQRDEIYEKAKAQGYTIARGFDDYKANGKNAKKLMLYQKEVATDLPYAIDREEGDLTLAQITEAGIEFLSKKSKKGFFFMVEGGKIDYASHSDDGATALNEVIDFDNAIKVAYEFYKKYPNETLIVVTADHETGGLVLGYSGAYALNLKALKGQKVSADRMASILRRASRARMELRWERVQELLKENFGLWGEIEMTKEETHELRVYFEQAYATTDIAKRESKLSSMAHRAKQMVNQKALLSWAGPNHSASFVPLFAIGAGAENFHGVIDNTDIPKTIKKIARYAK
ncbi:MAG: alkaline phosphatase [Bacteroidaceae bacterium]|nr:alkaline phosphatase [Bacteroidaceae bacterium]MBQ4039455.1 alkaline phosphatase [Bacteroidaceae bacterium]